MKWYVEKHSDADDPEDFPARIKVPAQIDERTVELLADWYHAEGGWECRWPLVFVIIDDEGVKHRFEVERHTVPEFEACELKQPCPQCSTPHVEVRHNDECGAQD